VRGTSPRDLAWPASDASRVMLGYHSSLGRSRAFGPLSRPCVGKASHNVGKLAAIQVSVETGVLDEFGVGAALDDAAVLHDEDLVGF